MSIHEQAAFDALMRQDLSSFIAKSFATLTPGGQLLPNWHLDAIAHALSECEAGRIRRLLITIPPRSLKSISATIAFPAWALGRDPARRIICASYSQDLSLKFARDSRALIESDWYRRAFPGTRLRKSAEGELITTKEGSRYATSVGGTLTGRGGNLLIIDDPIKPDEAMSKTTRERARDWFNGTLYSRLDNKKDDTIILIMQRLHLDDPAGHVLEAGGWHHLDLPAIAVTDETIPIGYGQVHHRNIGDILHAAREDRVVLDDIKGRLGSFFFEAQYQQNPLPQDGQIIKWAWVKLSDEPYKRMFGDTIVQSWDTASKAGELNDYSVCTTWAVRDEDYYLIHVLRDRLDYPSLKRTVLENRDRFEADTVLIEDAGSGMALIQDLPSEGLYPIEIKPEGDKVTRMSAQSAKIEAGHVILPKSAPWLGDLRAELTAFPNGRHDDQVDSIAQFLAWQTDRNKYVVGQFPLGGLV